MILLIACVVWKSCYLFQQQNVKCMRMELMQAYFRIKYVIFWWWILIISVNFLCFLVTVNSFFLCRAFKFYCYAEYIQSVGLWLRLGDCSFGPFSYHHATLNNHLLNFLLFFYLCLKFTSSTLVNVLADWFFFVSRLNMQKNCIEER